MRTCANAPFFTSSEVNYPVAGPLKKVFSRDELGIFGERMSERVRLRQGLDEVEFLGEGESGTSLEMDSEERLGADEQFEQSQEIRRLLPY